MSAASLIKMSAAAGAMLLLAACGGSDTASSSSVAAVESSQAVVATATVSEATTPSAPAVSVAPVADTTVSSTAEAPAASSEVVAQVPDSSDGQPAIPTLSPDQASQAAPPTDDTATPVAATAASGQAAAPANPAQNWLKVCGPTPSGQRACLMRQVIVTPDNHFLGSFLLSESPSQESPLVAVAAVPLGVLLPFGMTWQIDGGKPIRVPYMLCDAQSCATQLVINEAYLGTLKKGTKLTLVAKNRENKDLTIIINLAGFKTVYDGQASVSSEDFNKSQSGQQALEKVLADRAAHAAQALTSGPSNASGQ